MSPGTADAAPPRSLAARLAAGLRAGPPGRWLLVAALLAAWAGLSARVLRTAGVPHPTGLATLVPLDALVTPGPWAALTAALVVALGAFGARRRPAVAGGIALAVLLLGGWLEVWQWPAGESARYGKRLPVAALAGFLVAAGLAGGDAARRERVGHEAACGVVAAAYVLAGLAKLQASGLGWARGGHLALLVAERAGEGAAVLRPLREALALSPTLCGALAAGALLVELGGVAFLAPRLRRPFALAAVALHGGIALAMGYWYLPWVLLVTGLAFSSLAPSEPPRAPVTLSP